MESLQYKVLEFDMPAEDFDPNFTPENGIQYLQQVAYERERCPAVVVKPLVTASSDDGSMPTPSWSNLKPNSAPSADPVDLPDIHLPTDEWKRIQYAEFAQLREQITQLRPQFARRAGAGGAANAALPDIDDQQAWRVFMHANRPLLSTMLRLDQPSLEQVLDYQLEWLLQGDSDAGVDDADDADDEDDAVNTAATMSPTWDLAGLAALGRWIYSLLGCLHTPLEPDVHSTLRAIAKTALGIRNGLADDESGAEMAAPLNLLVCIIAANFGQADLANRV